MAPSSPASIPRITALDFDANRRHRRHSRESGRHSRESGRRTFGDEDFDFMGEVAQEIIERDRRKMRREVVRVLSFVCAVLCCLCAGSITSFSLYGARFLTDLHYTQYRVNAVSIVAELAMYLPVPLYGYLCDRYSPPPLALLSTFLFGFGYLLAAYTYKSGPPADATRDTQHGWPFSVMILAFIGIGSGTSCMYLSAVATCAKNFATAKYRGFMLAVPIAAFGLSGMWESQVGAHLLYQKLPDGRKGEVDVFKYFVFLAGTLVGVGLLGTLGLRIVDEEELIEHGVENLERSGLLDESEFFRESPDPTPAPRTYGTIGESGSGTATPSDDNFSEDFDLSESQLLKKREQEGRLRKKKWWLLNHATHAFLTDHTMWLLAAGFLLLTGPGEAYINNLGTIIPTLTPENYFDLTSPPAGHASTHVSIIALASTIARLFTGTLSDLFAPPSVPDNPPSTRVSFSRLVLLLPSAFLLFLAFVNLALPFLTAQHPSLFLLSSTLVGLGYGASFSLVPIIISVVWGAENFATNWGVVALMPAGGAAAWSIVYSVAYSRAADGEDGECRGYACFGTWAIGCSASVAVAIVLWSFAWKLWKQRNVAV
ncbi:putative monocarboxylate transporter mch1 [Exophiala dermatitidis]|uniref:Probable transporter MCH1 n=1 Tax=Exophiala dermatitidis TaxID=5970 RepID=A0AAN6IRL2_EXODE|nr:putative monocarboxylate transporter mch1 [Exophiala dermatitidis]KAJ4510030.1 putative monocarboxylate transporter mch1 [Exophiala dermatitidis]KAJ4521718.1 putative monocarboxylate transporter mch1 [Exophiala dermatitidis]KAJ4539410.1 putative monocarboxylate transporter mch1 [Exophiala dermatitidis]KAJ4542799.1 putative monocarboxylate transporter mch1 [Exophiala dermatitidis]